MVHSLQLLRTLKPAASTNAVTIANKAYTSYLEACPAMLMDGLCHSQHVWVQHCYSQHDDMNEPMQKQNAEKRATKMIACCKQMHPIF